MKSFESLRLIFRPFQLQDAELIHAYLQEKEIIDNTISIPYPYQKGMAEQWIATHNEQQKLGDYKFAIVEKNENKLIGAIEIVVVEEFHHGVLGYWIAKPYWNNGYGTEAVASIIKFGFEELGLNKIIGEHFDTNMRSQRIMEKNGMQLEAKLREHKMKWDKFVNVEMRAILKSEWNNKNT